MKFSVIIPTCQRNDQLSRCLEKLAPAVQNISSELYEVIVTDDGGATNAKQLIEKCFGWVKWLKGPKRGPAANRNNGAAHAKGEWLVFTDDDCIPADDWLQTFINAIDRFPEILAFEGAILPDDWNFLKEDMTECPVNTEGGCFWSANIMVDRSVFEKVGGFDRQFKIAANEDQDLYAKILQITNVQFLKNAVVIHPVKNISLIKKISMLGQVEVSQILLKRNQHFSGLENWKDGVDIHFFSAVNNIKKRKPKKFFYNAIGFLYRFFLGPIIIFKVYAEPKNADVKNKIESS